MTAGTHNSDQWAAFTLQYSVVHVASGVHTPALTTITLNVTRNANSVAPTAVASDFDVVGYSESDLVSALGFAATSAPAATSFLITSLPAYSTLYHNDVAITAPGLPHSVPVADASALSIAYTAPPASETSVIPGRAVLAAVSFTYTAVNAYGSSPVAQTVTVTPSNWLAVGANSSASIVEDTSDSVTLSLGSDSSTLTPTSGRRIVITSLPSLGKLVDVDTSLEITTTPYELFNAAATTVNFEAPTSAFSSTGPFADTSYALIEFGYTVKHVATSLHAATAAYGIVNITRDFTTSTTPRAVPYARTITGYSITSIAAALAYDTGKPVPTHFVLTSLPEGAALFFAATGDPSARELDLVDLPFVIAFGSVSNFSIAVTDVSGSEASAVPGAPSIALRTFEYLTRNAYGDSAEATIDITPSNWLQAAASSTVDVAEGVLARITLPLATDLSTDSASTPYRSLDAVITALPAAEASAVVRDEANGDVIVASAPQTLSSPAISVLVPEGLFVAAGSHAADTWVTFNLDFSSVQQGTGLHPPATSRVTLNVTRAASSYPPVAMGNAYTTSGYSNYPLASALRGNPAYPAVTSFSITSLPTGCEVSYVYANGEVETISQGSLPKTLPSNASSALVFSYVTAAGDVAATAIPGPAQLATKTVKYRAVNAYGESAEASLEVSVNNFLTAPLPATAAIPEAEDTVVSLSLGSDTSTITPASVRRIVITSLPTSGSLYDQHAGAAVSSVPYVVNIAGATGADTTVTITYRPDPALFTTAGAHNADAWGAHSFAYNVLHVASGVHATASTTFTVNVTRDAMSLAPVALASQHDVNGYSNISLAASLAYNAAATDSAVTSYTITALPAYSHLYLSGQVLIGADLPVTVPAASTSTLYFAYTAPPSVESDKAPGPASLPAVSFTFTATNAYGVSPAATVSVTASNWLSAGSNSTTTVEEGGNVSPVLSLGSDSSTLTPASARRIVITSLPSLGKLYDIDSSAEITVVPYILSIAATASVRFAVDAGVFGGSGAFAGQQWTATSFGYTVQHVATGLRAPTSAYVAVNVTRSSNSDIAIALSASFDVIGYSVSLLNSALRFNGDYPAATSFRLLSLPNYSILYHNAVAITSGDLPLDLPLSDASALSIAYNAPPASHTSLVPGPAAFPAVSFTYVARNDYGSSPAATVTVIASNWLAAGSNSSSTTVEGVAISPGLSLGSDSSTLTAASARRIVISSLPAIGSIVDVDTDVVISAVPTLLAPGTSSVRFEIAQGLFALAGSNPGQH